MMGTDEKEPEIAEELKRILTKVIYNDMSAMNAEEKRIGTTELAQETLSRADLVGIEAAPETRIMVQALRDIADAERAKEPHVIAGEALAEVGRMGVPATEVEAPEWNVSPDDRFLTSDTYGDAVALTEAEGIAKIEDFSGSNRPDQIRLERSETVQERKDRMKASLYKTLEGIREMGEEAHHSVVPTLSIAVMRAHKTLVEHEHDLRFSTQSLDVRVMELAMRTIGGSNQTPTYQAYPWVRADVVDIGVNAFKDGVEFLNKLDKQGVDVESEGIGTLAEMIRQEMGSSHAQLSEMVAAIAGAAIDEVNSMSHSVGQAVGSEPQKANEVGQGKRGIGIGL
jgi:predicted transcriptional regulator